LDLISNFDDFICIQQINLPHFDLKHKLSSLDRTHPIRQTTNISKSHKNLYEYVKSLSPENTVIFINDTCNLSGLKKLYLSDGYIKSGTCPNMNEVINAIMRKDGFWLVKKAISKESIPNNLMSPIFLLKEIMSFFNRKGVSLDKN
jgi:hypothetical protein